MKEIYCYNCKYYKRLGKSLKYCKKILCAMDGPMQKIRHNAFKFETNKNNNCQYFKPKLWKYFLQIFSYNKT